LAGLPERRHQYFWCDGFIPTQYLLDGSSPRITGRCWMDRKIIQGNVVMSIRAGASLIETLVVIAIIGTLLALLFPAVQQARRRALEVECKNNLNQINLAIADFAETHKRLPGPGRPDLVGGWTVEVLPFLEQKNLADRIAPGTLITSAPEYLLRQPRVFRCPVRRAGGEPAAGTMEPACYVFVPSDRRVTFRVVDAPTAVNVPWASGPEMPFDAVVRQAGPHNRGFFYASGFQSGVGFMLDGQDVR
jgi:type II secretory pathway pseudopilin PulG